MYVYTVKKNLFRDFYPGSASLQKEREREMKDGSGEVVQLKKTREKLFQLREIRLVNGIGAAPSHFNWTLETLTGSSSVFRPRSSTLEDILYARDDTFDRKIFNTNVRSNISEIRRNISINSNSYGCIKKSRPSSSNISRIILSRGCSPSHYCARPRLLFLWRGERRICGAAA